MYENIFLESLHNYSEDDINKFKKLVLKWYNFNLDINENEKVNNCNNTIHTYLFKSYYSSLCSLTSTYCIIDNKVPKMFMIIDNNMITQENRHIDYYADRVYDYSIYDIIYDINEPNIDKYFSYLFNYLKKVSI